MPEQPADPLDTLLAAQPAPHQVMLPVLGVPTRFAASDTRVLDAIEAEYGHGRSVEPSGATSPPMSQGSMPRER